MTKLNFILISAVALALTGCDSAKNALGIDHYQPDEFSVPENNPLTLPPDFSLRPADPKAPEKPASAVVTKGAAKASLSEKKLLELAGANSKKAIQKKKPSKRA